VGACAGEHLQSASQPRQPPPAETAQASVLDAKIGDAAAAPVAYAAAEPAPPPSRFQVVAKSRGLLRLIELDNSALVADSQLPLAIVEAGGKLTRPEHLLRGYAYPGHAGVRLVDAAGEWPKNVVLAASRSPMPYQNEAVTVRWNGAGWKAVGKPAQLYYPVDLVSWSGQRVLELQRRHADEFRLLQVAGPRAAVPRLPKHFEVRAAVASPSGDVAVCGLRLDPHTVVWDPHSPVGPPLNYEPPKGTATLLHFPWKHARPKTVSPPLPAYCHKGRFACDELASASSALVVFGHLAGCEGKGSADYSIRLENGKWTPEPDDDPGLAPHLQDGSQFAVFHQKLVRIGKDDKETPEPMPDPAYKVQAFWGTGADDLWVAAYAKHGGVLLHTGWKGDPVKLDYDDNNLGQVICEASYGKDTKSWHAHKGSGCDNLAVQLEHMP